MTLAQTDGAVEPPSRMDWSAPSRPSFPARWVVSFADGTQPAEAAHAHCHGAVDDALSVAGRLLLPDWALQIPQD